MPFFRPLSLLLACLGLRLAAAEPAEIVVYGATPGGIAAAVAAAKAGRSVHLVEPTARIGGMLTHGLSNSDFRSFESLSGFFLDFSRRVEAYYVAKYGAGSPQVAACFRGTHGEPSVNLEVLEAMIAELPRIRVWRRHSLVRVERTEFNRGRRRIHAAVFKADAGAEERLAGRVFIDGTYEGDLLAAAGEPYHVGRESRAHYGEPLAGNARGEGDGQVQGYNFRLVMTTREDNRLMPVAPAGYRRDEFVGVLPYFTEGRLTKVFSPGADGIYRTHLPLLPNDKADVNDTPRGPVRLSLPDLNDGYPEGDAATRTRIVREHYNHNIGLLYFLQNDTAVPEAIRADARRWGLCKDEFFETGGVPPMLYIREARRLVGQHVFTGADTAPVPGEARTRLRGDSIASGDYVHNCHGTGRTGTRFDGEHDGEFYLNVSPYQIPYGTIVPQRTENLLVPVACSASHFGFGALRLEPIWSSLGQAAGWAAHLAIQTPQPVQEVNVSALQSLLHTERSATLYVSDVAPDSADFAAVQWWALRGGFHGLASGPQPPPAPLVGQYTAAFPGHAAQLDLPLTPELRTKWATLLPAGIAAPTGATTRAEWLRLVFFNVRAGGR